MDPGRRASSSPTYRLRARRNTVSSRCKYPSGTLSLLPQGSHGLLDLWTITTPGAHGGYLLIVALGLRRITSLSGSLRRTVVRTQARGSSGQGLLVFGKRGLWLPV